MGYPNGLVPKDMYLPSKNTNGATEKSLPLRQKRPIWCRWQLLHHYLYITISQ
jgi:hypothetical protein